MPVAKPTGADAMDASRLTGRRQLAAKAAQPSMDDEHATIVGSLYLSLLIEKSEWCSNSHLTRTNRLIHAPAAKAPMVFPAMDGMSITPASAVVPLLTV